MRRLTINGFDFSLTVSDSPNEDPDNPEMHIRTTGSGAFVPREHVVHLRDSLDEWLKENPAKVEPQPPHSSKAAFLAYLSEEENKAANEASVECAGAPGWCTLQSRAKTLSEIHTIVSQTPEWEV